MKKTRLLLMALVIMASASVSMAQTLVTSTQASTTVILPKSDRVKGLVIRPEVGAGLMRDGFSNLNFGFQMNGTIAYQFNPFVAIGGGIGLERYDGRNFPMYGNFRAYFTDTKISPYLDIKIGMQNKKIMGSAMLGFQYKCFDVGAEIKCGWYHKYYGHDISWILQLNFAYNIQLGKK